MANEKKPKKIRLDELLVLRGITESRSQAKALILTGRIRFGTEILDKPGKSLPENIDLTLIEPPRFVGRGAEKIEAALDHFQIDCNTFDILDIGASTGGFTDALLQRGAATAVCVDVGHGQLHQRLRTDPRVTNLERINARHLSADDLPRPTFDLIAIDVSFISLRLILPPAWPLLAEDGWLIALIKPQFEATKAEVDRSGGVIKEGTIRERIIDEIKTFALDTLPDSTIVGLIDSPIAGAKGNKEFLLTLRKASQ